MATCSNEGLSPHTVSYQSAAVLMLLRHIDRDQNVRGVLPETCRIEATRNSICSKRKTAPPGASEVY